MARSYMNLNFNPYRNYDRGSDCNRGNFGGYSLFDQANANCINAEANDMRWGTRVKTGFGFLGIGNGLVGLASMIKGMFGSNGGQSEQNSYAYQSFGGGSNYNSFGYQNSNGNGYNSFGAQSFNGGGFGGGYQSYGAQSYNGNGVNSNSFRYQNANGNGYNSFGAQSYISNTNYQNNGNYQNYANNVSNENNSNAQQQAPVAQEKTPMLKKADALDQAVINCHDNGESDELRTKLTEAKAEYKNAAAEVEGFSVNAQSNYDKAIDLATKSRNGIKDADAGMTKTALEVTQLQTKYDISTDKMADEAKKTNVELLAKKKEHSDFEKTKLQLEAKLPGQNEKVELAKADIATAKQVQDLAKADLQVWADSIEAAKAEIATLPEQKAATAGEFDNWSKSLPKKVADNKEVADLDLLGDAYTNALDAGDDKKAKELYKDGMMKLAKEYIKTCDTGKKDGKIDLKEFKAKEFADFKAANQDLTPEELEKKRVETDKKIEKCFANMDLNGDKKIDEKEQATVFALFDENTITKERNGKLRLGDYYAYSDNFDRDGIKVLLKKESSIFG